MLLIAFAPPRAIYPGLVVTALVYRRRVQRVACYRSRWWHEGDRTWITKKEPRVCLVLDETYSGFVVAGIQQLEDQLQR
jgi:hypothetical protein